MQTDIPRSAARRPSAAKLRLLEVADRLFYAEGINTVGIDRIIAEAGVTKATFYKQWGSKDALILAYIEHRDQQVRESLETLHAASADGEQTIRTLVDGIAADLGRRDFRGCPFLNAASEFFNVAHPVRVAILLHRDWFIEFLEHRLVEMGHPAPGAAADELFLLRDGAMGGAYVGADPIASSAALHRAAERILADRRIPD